MQLRQLHNPHGRRAATVSVPEGMDRMESSGNGGNNGDKDSGKANEDVALDEVVVDTSDVVAGRDYRYYSLLTTYYSLLTTYYLLLTTDY